MVGHTPYEQGRFHPRKTAFARTLPPLSPDGKAVGLSLRDINILKRAQMITLPKRLKRPLKTNSILI